MPQISFRDIPRGFHIGLNAAQTALRVLVHKKIMENLNFKRQKSYIEKLQKIFGLGSFSNELDGAVGFAKTIRLRTIFADYAQYEIDFPDVEKNSMPCEYCAALQKDYCLFCNNTGRAVQQNSPALYSMAASLSVVLRVIPAFDCELPTEEKQLLQFTTTTDISTQFETFAMSGWISGELQEFVRARMTREQKDHVEHSMLAVRERMQGEQEHQLTSFKALFNDDGTMHLSCPGNACGIDPQNFMRLKDCNGYTFQSHNMTSPVQQLTIIAGLAALCDMADAEM